MLHPLAGLLAIHWYSSLQTQDAKIAQPLVVADCAASRWAQVSVVFRIWQHTVLIVLSQQSDALGLKDLIFPGTLLDLRACGFSLTFLVSVLHLCLQPTQSTKNSFYSGLSLLFFSMSVVLKLGKEIPLEMSLLLSLMLEHHSGSTREYLPSDSSSKPGKPVSITKEGVCTQIRVVCYRPTTALLLSTTHSHWTWVSMNHSTVFLALVIAASLLGYQGK